MIEIHAAAGKSYLVVRLSGVVNSSDFTEGMCKFDQLVIETQPVGLLIDWTDLADWGVEAEGLRFLARTEHRSTFERIAIIASDAWEAEVNRAEEILSGSVRRFSPSARESAEDWLEAVS